jgi:hypothetical protein
MEIILPNNIDEYPSIWNTNKTYTNQSIEAIVYVSDVINSEPITKIEDEMGRCLERIYIDVENNIKITISYTYKYSANDAKAFEIDNQTITLEKII